jgi:hypothetical protein
VAFDPGQGDSTSHSGAAHVAFERMKTLGPIASGVPRGIRGIIPDCRNQDQGFAACGISPFVMGIKNAVPAEEQILDFLHSELQRVLPRATWTAAGIGRHQS